jgi:hypothetical protein
VTLRNVQEAGTDDGEWMELRPYGAIQVGGGGGFSTGGAEPWGRASR